MPEIRKIDKLLAVSSHSFSAFNLIVPLLFSGLGLVSSSIIPEPYTDVAEK